MFPGLPCIGLKVGVFRLPRLGCYTFQHYSDPDVPYSKHPGPIPGDAHSRSSTMNHSHEHCNSQPRSTSLLYRMHRYFEMVSEALPPPPPLPPPRTLRGLSRSDCRGQPPLPPSPGQVPRSSLSGSRQARVRLTSSSRQAHARLTSRFTNRPRPRLHGPWVHM